MQPSKPGSRANKQLSSALRELFMPYGIPPSPLHQAVQEAARQAGWSPPWLHEEQLTQKKAAGKRSGTMRKGRADIRLSLVNIARDGLTPEQRRQPYANGSIEALCQRYRELFAYDGNDIRSRPSRLDALVPVILDSLSVTDRQSLKTVDRETLIKDLKKIRKQRGITRSIKRPK